MICQEYIDNKGDTGHDISVFGVYWDENMINMCRAMFDANLFDSNFGGDKQNIKDTIIGIYGYCDRAGGDSY